MSARDVLRERLTKDIGDPNADYWTYEEADAALDAFAHELAEKIRNSEELRDFTDDHMSDCNAAVDLIDPEVS
jgi:hypothetical protein